MLNTIKQQVIKTAITSFVSVIGQGGIFGRIKDEIVRANAAMPGATGADKRARVVADLEIIFRDLFVPVGASVLNLLLELAVAYMKTRIVRVV